MSGAISAAEATARVEQGAAHLDRVRPGWAHEIDVDRLAMHDLRGCVIDQLTGDSFSVAARERLGILGRTIVLGFDVGISELRGFSLDETSMTEAYQPLLDAWIAVIAARVVTADAPELVARQETGR